MRTREMIAAECVTFGVALAVVAWIIKLWPAICDGVFSCLKAFGF